MPDIKFLVSVDSKTAETSIKRLDDQIGKLPETTKKAAGPPGGFKNLWLQVGAGMAAFQGIMASMRGFIGAIKDVTEKAMIQEAVITQLEARLKSTKGAAGLTKDELLKMASGLQAVTTYGDETVVEAENLLLTFTNIGKKVFPDALETVLDMSTALGQDLKGSAIQLGKSLNDPIEGVTALKRVGVSFTDAQREQIKVLVESGNTLDAQRLILKELQTEFGGASRAAVEDFGGAMGQLKNYWGDLQEVLGTSITENEALRDLMGDLKDEIIILIETGKIEEWANAASKAVSGLVWAFKEFKDATTEFKPIPMQMAEGFSEWTMNMIGMKSPQQEMNRLQKEAALRAIEFKDSLKALSPSMDVIREHFEKGSEHADEWMKSVEEADRKAAAFNRTIDTFKDLWEKTNRLWEKAHPVIKTTTKVIETKLHPALKNLVDIQEILKVGQPILKDTFEEALPPARDFAGIVSNNVPAALESLRLANEITTEKIAEDWQKNYYEVITPTFEDWGGLLVTHYGLIAEFCQNIETAWQNMTSSLVDNLVEVGEGSENILEAVSETFTGFIDDMISNLGRLVLEEQLTTVRTWVAEQTKALARVASSVFAAIPFPFNIAAAAAAVVAVRGLFAKFKFFEEGGIVMRPTFGVIGEKGPEAVIPLNQMSQIYQTSQTSIYNRNITNTLRPQVLHVHTHIGNQELKEIIVKTVEKEGRQGRLRLPPKVIQK